ncbi:MAG: carbohydrate-selective porin [Cyanobacteriota bacterium]|jgi:hypothetical protein
MKQIISQSLFNISHHHDLSFPALFIAVISSISSVSAGEISKTLESMPSPSVKIDDVVNLSQTALQSPFPGFTQQQDLIPTVVSVSELSDSKTSFLLENSHQAKITSVSQLSDIKSSDWAFTALQSLIERYGAIVGDNNGKFRGNQVLTRYEFAASLNTVLNKINEIILTGFTDKISKEDFAIIQKLQTEFATELATIRGRIDTLDTRTAKLEAQQFSTTTKLIGSTSFLMGGVTSSGTKTGGTSRNANLILSYASNFRLNTSFTGKDMLSINLGANNAPSLFAVTGTYLSSFTIDSSTATIPPNNVGIAQLFYRFPVGDKITVWISDIGLQPFDYFPVISPLRNGVSVPNSRYALFNPPIFRPGFNDTGIGAAYLFSNQWQLHIGYFANSDQANKPNSGGFGIFNSSSTIATQLTFQPSKQLSSSLNFIHKYFTGLNISGSNLIGAVNRQGATGTNFSLAPFGNQPTNTDTFGGQFEWRIVPKVGLGGWFSTTAANNLKNGQKATVINAAVSLGFFDLFQEGNHGGILVGIPPYVSSNDNGARKDVNTPWHLEVFYTHRFTDNISITPDFFVILNPDNGTTDLGWDFAYYLHFLNSS